MRSGNTGVAVSFVTAQNEDHFNLIEKRILKAKMFRESLPGFEPDEAKWNRIKKEQSLETPHLGTKHSKEGLAHDKMYGGIKGKRKSKKDKLREKAAAEAKIVEQLKSAGISDELYYS